MCTRLDLCIGISKELDGERLRNHTKVVMAMFTQSCEGWRQL